MFPTFIAVARARYLNSIVGVKKNNGQPGPLGVWGSGRGGDGGWNSILRMKKNITMRHCAKLNSQAFKKEKETVRALLDI